MNMTRHKALSLLGLSLEENPTEEEIKKAYRKQAMIFHPDRNKDKPEYEEKFKEIASAYEFLSNKTKTDTEYNAHSDVNVEEMLRKFFGGAGPGPRSVRKRKPNPSDMTVKARHVNLGELTVTLEQALFQEPIVLNVEVQAACKDCYSDKDLWLQCSQCDGFGVVVETSSPNQGMVFRREFECPICRGRGWVRKGKCKTCRNRLVYTKKKKVSTSIAENYKLGKGIRVEGMGNESWRAKDGDLLFTPRIVLPDIDKLDQEDRTKLKEILGKL